jgi:hypothetical protein
MDAALTRVQFALAHKLQNRRAHWTTCNIQRRWGAVSDMQRRSALANKLRRLIPTKVHPFWSLVFGFRIPSQLRLDLVWSQTSSNRFAGANGKVLAIQWIKVWLQLTQTDLLLYAISHPVHPVHGQVHEYHVAFYFTLGAQSKEKFGEYITSSHFNR